MDFPLLDDIGSFPLPQYTNEDLFKAYYWPTYRGVLQGKDVKENLGLKANVVHPIEKCFVLKRNSGLDVVNFPQLMDIYSQFLNPINRFQKGNEPHLIDPKKARILEVELLKDWAKRQYESGKIEDPVKIKVCVTGPLELYFKVIGFEVYSDMAANFSRSINAFLKNSLVDEPYMKTEVVSIDEPSLGYVTITNTTEDEMIQVYDEAVKDIDVDVQIHLHSLNSFKIPLQTENIDVLTCEFASNPQNVIDKKYLDQYDKFMRVGVCRTNINAIMAGEIEKGQSYGTLNTIEGLKTLIDSEARIERNLQLAIGQYGERLRYVGPDCGLSAWAPPQIAALLLERTCKVVKDFARTSK